MLICCCFWPNLKVFSPSKGRFAALSKGKFWIEHRIFGLLLVGSSRAKLLPWKCPNFGLIWLAGALLLSAFSLCIYLIHLVKMRIPSAERLCSPFEFRYRFYPRFLFLLTFVFSLLAPLNTPYCWLNLLSVPFLLCRLFCPGFASVLISDATRFTAGCGLFFSPILRHIPYGFGLHFLLRLSCLWMLWGNGKPIVCTFYLGLNSRVLVSFKGAKGDAYGCKKEEGKGRESARFVFRETDLE